MLKNVYANGLSKGHDHPVLRILFWNAGGISNDKFTELKNIIATNNVDVYCIVEAGAATDNLEFYQSNGYQTYALKRGRQISSGIIVAARSSITVNFHVHKEMTASDKLECAELEVWKGKRHRRIFIAYNPPGNKPELGWLEAKWDENSLLCGDLNAPSVRWGYSRTDAVGGIWEDFIDSNPVLFLDNTNCEPTFLSYSGHTSHPDVVLAHPSKESEIFHTLLHAPGSCGHKILLIDLFSTSKQTVVKKRTRWNIKKAKWKLYKQVTNDSITHDLLCNNVDRSLKKICDAILSSAVKAVPRGRMKKFSPFWNDSLETLKKERDRAREVFERTRLQSDKIYLKRKQALLKKSIIQAKRLSYKTFLQNLDFRKDGITAHKFISTLANRKPKENRPLKKDDSIITDEAEIARFFCKYYNQASNYKPKKENGKPNTSPPATCLSERDHVLFNDDFKLPELEAALKMTKSNKSAGPDEIMPAFLLHLGSRAKVVILAFLNLIWEKGLPAMWRKAEIVPILKKGKSPTQPSHFRPIALTSCFCKVLERMVLARLQYFLEENNLISNHQAGFKPHRSTMDNVIRLSQHIKHGFQHKQSTLAVFIDFKGAFDNVWRGKLLNKMLKMGVHGNIFRFVRSFLAQRFIRVRYNEAVSTFRQMKQGLPQGSVISPVLFNIMINDIIEKVETNPGINALLYADDLVIWATSSDIRALEVSLNESLATIKKWASSNEMIVNPNKTEFQLFTLSSKSYSISLQYGQEPIVRSTAASYLGVKLDQKLTWSKHSEQLVDKGKRRLALLNRLTGTKWGATQDVLTLAYKAYVRPVIEYGGEALITATDAVHKKVDRVQNAALRVILGAPRSTPITAMELQADIDPLQTRRELAALTLIEKLKRAKTGYWEEEYVPMQRLKTQNCFTGKIQEIRTHRELQELENREPFECTSLRTIPQLASSNMKLLEEVSKKATPPCVLRNLALESIMEIYPPSMWVHLYTDGSAEGANRNAGAGVFSQYFQLSVAVGKVASNYDAEIHAILLALNKVQEKGFEKTVLLVDSQAAIEAVTSHGKNDNKAITKCKEIIDGLLTNGKEVVLQWIPGHVGITGNEEADRLAKNGAQQNQPDNPISFPTVVRELKRAFRERLQREQKEKSAGKAWSALAEPAGRLPNDLPRSTAVACFRMQTGHDYLQKHLHKIGVQQSSMCELCNGGEMDALHLRSCPALKNVRERLPKNKFLEQEILYWAARRQMAEVANDRVGVG